MNTAILIMFIISCILVGSLAKQDKGDDDDDTR